MLAELLLIQCLFCRCIENIVQNEAYKMISTEAQLPCYKSSSCYSFWWYCSWWYYCRNVNTGIYIHYCYISSHWFGPITQIHFTSEAYNPAINHLAEHHPRVRQSHGINTEFALGVSVILQDSERKKQSNLTFKLKCNVIFK